MAPLTPDEYDTALKAAWDAPAPVFVRSGCCVVLVEIYDEVHQNGIQEAAVRLGLTPLTKAYGARPCLKIGFDDCDGKAIAKGTVVADILGEHGIPCGRRLVNAKPPQEIPMAESSDLVYVLADGDQPPTGEWLTVDVLRLAARVEELKSLVRHRDRLQGDPNLQGRYTELVADIRAMEQTLSLRSRYMAAMHG